MHVESMNSDKTIVRPDGRRLAYCGYGATDGAPLFFFHGRPGSRLDFAPNDPAAADANVRVPAVDRPGIGGSDPQPGRTVLDWPTDGAALADSLALDRFAVLGFSGLRHTRSVWPARPFLRSPSR